MAATITLCTRQAVEKPREAGEQTTARKSGTARQERRETAKNAMAQNADSACEVELRVKGHAGYAPPGQDIVCAAVSALTCTFGACLQQYEAEGRGRVLAWKMEPGDVRFRFRLPAGDQSASAWAGIAALQTGYALLAESYPAHVFLRLDER